MRFCFPPSSSIMECTEDDDLILAEEVRASEPWIFKARTVDRGKVWNAIMDRLNDETSVKFKVKSAVVFVRKVKIFRRVKIPPQQKFILVYDVLKACNS